MYKPLHVMFHRKQKKKLPAHSESNKLTNATVEKVLNASLIGVYLTSFYPERFLYQTLLENYTYHV